MERVLHHSDSLHITKKGLWLVVNKKKYGFLMEADDGTRLIVCFKRQIEVFQHHKGFYVPSPLVTIPHIFECKIPKRAEYYHYQYDAKKKQTCYKSDPFVFVGLSKMDFTKDAERFTKPPFPKE